MSALYGGRGEKENGGEAPEALALGASPAVKSD